MNVTYRAGYRAGMGTRDARVFSESPGSLLVAVALLNLPLKCI